MGNCTIIVGGEATLSSFFPEISGGLSTGGSATVAATYNFTGSGGVILRSPPVPNLCGELTNVACFAGTITTQQQCAGTIYVEHVFDGEVVPHELCCQ